MGLSSISSTLSKMTLEPAESSTTSEYHNHMQLLSQEEAFDNIHEVLGAPIFTEAVRKHVSGRNTSTLFAKSDESSESNSSTESEDTGNTHGHGTLDFPLGLTRWQEASTAMDVQQEIHESSTTSQHPQAHLSAAARAPEKATP